MGSKVEKLEVALAQNLPFEDEVVELAPKFISTEARELMWWRRADSNRRPPACKAGALAS